MSKGLHQHTHSPRTEGDPWRHHRRSDRVNAFGMVRTNLDTIIIKQCAKCLVRRAGMPPFRMFALLLLGVSLVAATTPAPTEIAVATGSFPHEFLSSWRSCYASKEFYVFTSDPNPVFNVNGHVAHTLDLTTTPGTVIPGVSSVIHIGLTPVVPSVGAVGFGPATTSGAANTYMFGDTHFIRLNEADVAPFDNFVGFTAAMPYTSVVALGGISPVLVIGTACDAVLLDQTAYLYMDDCSIWSFKHAVGSELGIWTLVVGSNGCSATEPDRVGAEGVPDAITGTTQLGGIGSMYLSLDGLFIYFRHGAHSNRQYIISLAAQTLDHRTFTGPVNIFANENGTPHAAYSLATETYALHATTVPDAPYAGFFGTSKVAQATFAPLAVGASTDAVWIDIIDDESAAGHVVYLMGGAVDNIRVATIQEFTDAASLNQCVGEGGGHECFVAAGDVPSAVCTDTIAGYDCACAVGSTAAFAETAPGVFSPQLGSTCDDVDECAVANVCHATAVCTTPTFNAHVCACPVGYSGDPEFGGAGCVSVDECAAGGFCVDTAPASGGECTDIVGAGLYTCGCQSGFDGNGYLQADPVAHSGITPDGCTNVDDCPGSCGANTACADGINAFTCTCLAGFENTAGDLQTGGDCLPIDDCALTPCGTGAICTDIHLGRTCACPVGFGPAGAGDLQDLVTPEECVSIDECASDGTFCVSTLTAAGGICTDIVGAGLYTCGCEAGFTGNGYVLADPVAHPLIVTPDGCTDIDECATTPCGSNTDCANGINERTCTCSAGFELPAGDDLQAGDSCVDIVECDNLAISDCSNTAGVADPGVLCANTVGGHTCSCDAGFTGTGYTGTGCTDDNECIGEGGGNNCAAVGSTCTNTPGNFECACDANYEDFSGDGDAGTVCDVDQCATAAHSCYAGGGLLPAAGCTNILDPVSGDGFTCACSAGTKDSDPGATGEDIGKTCVDIDECIADFATHPHDCSIHATCSNIDGSFTCECPLTYYDPAVDGANTTETLGRFCTPANYCEAPVGDGSGGDGYNTCQTGSALSTCANLESVVVAPTIDTNFQCTCPAGYYPFDANAAPGLACVEIDECANGLDGNSPGSAVCDALATCTNLPLGSHTCACQTGYFTEDDGVTCEDIDECSAESALCPQPGPGGNGACTHGLGGVYTCGCLAGFELTGTAPNQVCTNIDECTLGTHNCGSLAPTGGAICTDNTGDVAGFECSCESGFTQSGTVGTGFTCADDDECSGEGIGNNCGANTGCSNAPAGSFTCACSEFFEGDPISGCTDIDECAPGAGFCPEAGGVTHGTCSTGAPGEVTCGCDAGYALVGTAPGACVDINECDPQAQTHNCGLLVSDGGGALCTNTDGGFTCACDGPGYTQTGSAGAGYACDSIDECGVTDVCVAAIEGGRCTETDQLYTCECIPGYAGDGYPLTETNPSTLIAGTGCTDIDYCSLPGNCVAAIAGPATCTEEPAGFTCECDTGYASTDNFLTCPEILECSTGAHNCGDLTPSGGATCTEAGASLFTCGCLPGFTQSGDAQSGFTCTDDDECTLGTHNCGANTDCTNTDGSFTCACQSFYEGDPLAGCTDINECVVGNEFCAPVEFGGACQNNVGGPPTCSCKPGYHDGGLGGAWVSHGYEISTCEQNNECAAAGHGCHANAECIDLTPHTNPSGETHECRCDDGYFGDGESCAQIDQCYPVNNQGGLVLPIPNGGVCRLTSDPPGDPDCADYTGPGTEYQTLLCMGSRTECNFSFDTPVCPALSTCSTVDGEKICTCDAGYTMNPAGTECIDNDECTLETDDCHETLSTCNNLPGTFECVCDLGYDGNGHTTNDVLTGDGCTPRDACGAITPPCGDNTACTNNFVAEPFHTCACNPGFETATNGQDPAPLEACFDIPECVNDPALCAGGGVCTEAPLPGGVAACVCHAGFAIDPQDSQRCILVESTTAVDWDGLLALAPVPAIPVDCPLPCTVQLPIRPVGSPVEAPIEFDFQSPGQDITLSCGGEDLESTAPTFVVLSGPKSASLTITGCTFLEVEQLVNSLPEEFEIDTSTVTLTGQLDLFGVRLFELTNSVLSADSLRNEAPPPSLVVVSSVLPPLDGDFEAPFTVTVGATDLPGGAALPLSGPGAAPAVSLVAVHGEIVSSPATFDAQTGTYQFTVVVAAAALDEDDDCDGLEVRLAFSLAGHLDVETAPFTLSSRPRLTLLSAPIVSVPGAPDAQFTLRIGAEVASSSTPTDVSGGTLLAAALSSGVGLLSCGAPVFVVASSPVQYDLTCSVGVTAGVTLGDLSGQEVTVRHSLNGYRSLDVTFELNTVAHLELVTQPQTAEFGATDADWTQKAVLRALDATGAPIAAPALAALTIVVTATLDGNAFPGLASAAAPVGNTLEYTLSFPGTDYTNNAEEVVFTFSESLAAYAPAVADPWPLSTAPVPYVEIATQPGAVAVGPTDASFSPAPVVGLRDATGTPVQTTNVIFAAARLATALESPGVDTGLVLNAPGRGFAGTDQSYVLNIVGGAENAGKTVALVFEYPGYTSAISVQFQLSTPAPTPYLEVIDPFGHNPSGSPSADVTLQVNAFSSTGTPVAMTAPPTIDTTLTLSVPAVIVPTLVSGTPDYYTVLISYDAVDNNALTGQTETYTANLAGFDSDNVNIVLGDGTDP